MVRRPTATSLAEVIRDAIDPSLELEFDEAREGDTEHTHADISKANELLGYESTSISERASRRS